MSAAKIFIAAVTSLAICAVAVRGETCAEVVDGVALIPEGTLAVAEDAFRNCDALQFVMIPSSVTVLGNSAFRGSGLEKLKFAAGSRIESLGVQVRNQLFFTPSSCRVDRPCSPLPAQTFEECCALKKISIPKTVETLDFTSFASSGLEDITFDVTSLQPDKNNLVFLFPNTSC